ncbi:MATE family efflux transporter [Clostridium sp. MSJ-11]|uniref:Multidrug export protein MepA n=1 Tax=Clostridium mobile TaxID=2841512 RepID=A0ABS6ELX1_9CLOT|nr:MATE family efflux transporter [Clostridium mobile]MBU5486214.1 MATE family efflux transporter [Clostridium mobile]
MDNVCEVTNNKKSLLRLFLSYAIPGIAGLLFNSMYILVDGLFVARILGREALAAVTVGVPVVEVLLALSMLISVGAGVLISNSNGAGDTKEGRRIFNLSFRLLMATSIIIAGLSLIFIYPLSSFLGATPDIIDLVVEYLRYFFAFSPAFMLSYGMCTWLRNDSKPSLVMIAQIVGALSNIILDWYFMVPLEMGLAGAALATGLGPVFSILIMLPHFLRKKGNLYFQKVKLDIATILLTIKRGIPSFMMEFALGITTLICNIAIGIHMGSLGFAAYGIVGYIALIATSIFLGMAEGSQPLISFFHGAEEDSKIKDIINISLIISTVIGTVTYFLLYNFGKYPVSVFAGKDIDLINTSVNAVIYYFPALFISGINIVIASGLQSIGHWRESVVISLCRSLILLLPLLFVLPTFLGNNGVWVSVPIAEVLTAFIAYFFLKKFILNAKA